MAVNFMRSLLLAAVSFAVCSVLAIPTNPSLERRARAQVYTRCSVPNTVALTFDDGPYIYLKDIVNALDNAGAKGTFFFNDCIYSQAGADRVKYAYSHGHQVASHTWSHKDLTTLSSDKKALVKITGANPAFMRPPYGNYNNLVLDASGARGQSVAIWDFDSQDSVGASVQTSKNLYNNIINKHPSTILALNHETYETTAHQVLPYAIQRLKSAGYRLVTLAECVGKPPYQSVVAPKARDSTWHC
ncbi:carbohydrate esterase family 4 protein [Agrocybe pediades]|nr:carbohydrate esterase family 4 protein [Agrocybe pediades]KAF9559601.1 carbohydrate esterase family 4 protein [Agrocybe pediades]